MFVLDWSDTGECHELDGVHRSSGRIYRITHGNPARVATGDVSRLGQPELVALHRGGNEWFVRQTRRTLAERHARGEKLDEAKRLLRAMFETDPDPVVKIRALCSLFIIAGDDPSWLRGLLHHEHVSVRAWTIRFLTDALPIDTVESRRGGPDVPISADDERELASLARADSSGLVRLVLASTLQRLPVDQRVGLARTLVSRAEDAGDHNIPAMVWTGLIPVAQADPDALVALAAGCKLPLVLRLIARRLSEDIETRPAPLNRLLDAAAASPKEFQAQVIWGMVDALSGWRKARKPAGWDRLRQTLGQAADPSLCPRARDLDVLFGDGRALDEVRRLALEDSAPLDVRKAALKTLFESRPPDLRAICERLVRVRFLNLIAAVRLPYSTRSPPGRSPERTSRPSTLGRSAASAIRPSPNGWPRCGVSCVIPRTIGASGSSRSRSNWTLVSWPTPTRAEAGSCSNGCTSCHKLYGYGGEIGPDLTGAGCDKFDYLLENVVDPSASVTADFRMVVVALTDGRVLNGLVRARTDGTLTLQTQAEAVVLDRGDIEDVRSSPFSLMPDGLLDPLSPDEVRDLVAYLMHRTQVPLPGQRR